ncbi:hypothetical protein HK101_010353 [Irineochytrium annulatum]|nr:hypothetical protein HK101_010353 [Irineochytrium annulatum]
MNEARSGIRKQRQVIGPGMDSFAKLAILAALGDLVQSVAKYDHSAASFGTDMDASRDPEAGFPEAIIRLVREDLIKRELSLQPQKPTVRESEVDAMEIDGGGRNEANVVAGIREAERPVASIGDGAMDEETLGMGMEPSSDADGTDFVIGSCNAVLTSEPQIGATSNSRAISLGDYKKEKATSKTPIKTLKGYHLLPEADRVDVKKVATYILIRLHTI